MSGRANVSQDTNSVTVSVPLAIRSRSGRKQVVTPAAEPGWAPRQAEIDGALVKALARAFRWRRLLENGDYATIAELARAEKINGSYVSRVLRLTLLAPRIVEAILDGCPTPELTTGRLFRAFPVEWDEQRRLKPL